MVYWVYIVDDDDALRASLETLISVEGRYRARGFVSGDAFLATRPDLEPGCVLLDFSMPGATGMDVLVALQAERERFIAIFLTGEGDIPLAVAALKAGAFDFLEKPCAPEILLETVSQAFMRLSRSNEEQRRIEAAEAKIARLSQRESEVLGFLIHGRSNKVIAYELAISPRTVEIYRANVMEKLGVRSLSEALRVAFTAGMLPN